MNLWFGIVFLPFIGLMADVEKYNPDANVPLWVNIVIPIISATIFMYIFISEPMV